MRRRGWITLGNGICRRRREDSLRRIQGVLARRSMSFRAGMVTPTSKTTLMATLIVMAVFPCLRSPVLAVH